MLDSRTRATGSSTERDDWRRTVAIVFAVTAFTSWIAWEPLSLPGRIVSALLPGWNCVGWVPGSAGMYFCSASVAVANLAGTIASLCLLWLVRRHVVTAVSKLASQVPSESRFLLAPVLASLLFTLYWAPLHYETGLVQKVFPAVVGVFAFVAQRYGPTFQNVLAARGFYEWRDPISRPIRIVIAILIPLVVSLILTSQERVTAPALKEQFVVILALCTGYLALTPRHGDLGTGIRDIRK